MKIYSIKLLISLGCVFSLIACSPTAARVVAFGDSITVGRPFDGEHVYSYAYGFAEDLGRSLNNQAVSGSKIDDDNQIGRIRRFQFQSDDVVLLLTGTNSAFYYGNDLNQYENFRSLFREAVSTIAKNKVVLVVGTPPHRGDVYDTFVTHYAQIIREVVSELNLPNILLADVNAQMDFDYSRFVEDLVHPNLDGQHIMLNIFNEAYETRNK